MSKYKIGDKVVMEIMRVDDGVDLMNVGSCGCSWCIPASQIDRMSEPLSTYTEPLEAKIRRQAAEITRLLAENKRLKAENGNSLWNIEQARAEGQNEAWELARKCMLMTDRERKAIFGSGHNALYGVLTYFDYKHAAAKVTEWEKAKEEIKVGDVLEDIADNNVKCVVTKPYSSNMAYLVFRDGSAGLNELDNLRKTDRHTDIDSFLNQIGGKENEGNL